MFSRKERYSLPPQVVSLHEQSSTGVKLIKSLTGLSDQQIINNALQLHTEIEDRRLKGESLVYQKPQEYYSEFDPSPKINLERVVSEQVEGSISEPYIVRFSDRTTSLMGGVPSGETFDDAINTYVAAAGHAFLGEPVLTEKKNISLIAYTTSYETKPLATKLPRMKTVKEPKYKGKHGKK